MNVIKSFVSNLFKKLKRKKIAIPNKYQEPDLTKLEGYIPLDGRTISKTDYPELYRSLEKEANLPEPTFSFTDQPLPEAPLSQAEVIVNKIKSGESVSMTEINIVLSDLLDVHAVEGTVHRLNKYLLDEAVFIIDKVNVIADKHDNFQNITFTLKETIFNLNMEISIDSKTFHEAFSKVDLPETSPR